MKTLVKIRIKDRLAMNSKIGKVTVFYSINNPRQDLITVELDTAWSFNASMNDETFGTVTFTGYDDD